MGVWERVGLRVAAGCAFGAGALLALGAVTRPGASRAGILLYLLGDSGVVLAGLAVVGLYRVLSGSKAVGQAGVLGGILGVLAAALGLVMVVYDGLWLLVGPGMYGQTLVPTPTVISQVPYLAVWGSLLLLGVEALLGRRFGKWRWLPLALALALFPTPAILSGLLAPGEGLGIRSLGVPLLLPAAGWVGLGILLWTGSATRRPSPASHPGGSAGGG
ncbi:hypothetical protein Rxycam_01266 [Rubrobacter xylanophilus DSM 9941]|uniref:hypothetical protein n=1 Tax=Rubrobacter xylanophilus TaxID=49319 RepID=UPI001C63C275|nr:hypothetical protein [Rubrobacter xylanophilus]QYJ15443.1 hypothetical protein Rxycam_01266 [Rubrobacter xylanophilus DSM 9941]